MDVYLIQHAHSKLKEEDPMRPLTDEGKKAIQNVAAHCAKLGMTVDRIYYSGKLRAQETAEILARYLRASDRVEARPGLDPLDDVKPTELWLKQRASEGMKAIGIVGHLPFLDKLASLLVAGNEAAGVIAFRNAGVVKLIPKASVGGYTIEWILTPQITGTL